MTIQTHAAMNAVRARRFQSAALSRLGIAAAHHRDSTERARRAGRGVASGESGSGWAFVTNGIATLRTAASAMTALVMRESMMSPAGAGEAAHLQKMVAAPH